MKIDSEKRIVGQMIKIYCRKKEGNKYLCNNCKELLDYAINRLDKCPWGDKKKACKKCTIHCYKPQMREKIKIIMRYSGPRMLLYAPIQTIKHLLNR